MNYKYNPENNIDQISSKISLRTDNDLFDDKLHIVHNLITIKFVSLPNNGENWEIYNNDEVVFTLPGVKLTKKERKILRTSEGLLLLLNEYKSGNKSISKIKSKLRNLYNKKNDNI